MIQDLDTTIEKLAERREQVQLGDTLVPRLYETIARYATEVVRDLGQTEWRSQFQGGLNAGYILCLMGQTEKGVEFLDKSLQIHQANKGQYDESRSTVLEFVIETLEGFGVDDAVVSPYKTQLEQAREQEIEKPEDLRRKIVHIEADMECTAGDLDAAYSHGRREQGLLYQKLGEHEQAIAHFRQSMEEDRRDWRSETSIRNKLSIVDSYLAAGDQPAAVQEFMELMKKLVPDKLELGDKIPDLFTENFSQFALYLEKLGMEENLETVANYARARIEKLKDMIHPPAPKEDHKEHWKRSELCQLTRIVASYHVGGGEYQEASDLYDQGREHLEYKHHLSRRDQAEFAIRAGNPAKAQALVREDEAEKDQFGREDGKTEELVNLYLQLGNVGTALDRLDQSCEHHKAGLVSGSYSHIFETRQTQLAIFRAIMGDDYFQKARAYQSGQAELFPNNGLKFLPESLGNQ